MNDERDPEQCLVDRELMIDQVVITDILTVIGRKDKNRILE